MELTMDGRRPPGLRRSWLFVPGLDELAQHDALDVAPDVMVADLEEFTLPADRPAARQRIGQLIRECRARHIVAAVRINTLEQDGEADLQAIMAGGLQAIFLPHAEGPEQIERLDGLLAWHENRLGKKQGSTEIVPTLESALAVVRTSSILAASKRITACLLAAEDLSSDLGLERGPDGIELRHIRTRFQLECMAAGCLPIDCPFNYRDQAMLVADLGWARRVGFKSKCAVFHEQITTIHAAYTPSAQDAQRAGELVLRYERQRQGTPCDGATVEAPDANTARRLCQRYEQFEEYGRSLAGRSDSGVKQ